MKIICGLGTAVRFALACLALGAVLGFLLGAASHPHRPGDPVATGAITLVAATQASRTAIESGPAGG